MNAVRLSATFVALSSLLGVISACGAPLEEETASSENALGECSRATVTATAGLNLRRQPALNAEILTSMEHGAIVDVIEKTADGSWAKIGFGGQTGWASAAYLECTTGGGNPTPNGACAAGEARHAFVRAASTPVLAEASGSATALFHVPYGQKLIVDPTTPASDFTRVVIPTLDGDEGTDRVRGFVATSAIATSAFCRPSGLLQKDLVGARFLLGEAAIARPLASDNAKNMIKGGGRVDGAVVQPSSSFTYLEYVADDNRGSQACASDSECDGEYVCHQRGACGPYFFGIGTGGDELWASGVCGTATAIHRAALDASLLPTAYTNHDHFISTYGYVGIDAEVWWSGGAPGATGQHYRFFNDSGGKLVLVAGSRVRNSQLEATMQIWGTVADDRYSEHEVVDLGGGHVELRRKLTRIGAGERVSPPLSVEGTGNIRKIGQSSAPVTGGVATTEDFRIDSYYDGSIRLPPGKIYSRRHPSR